MANGYLEVEDPGTPPPWQVVKPPMSPAAPVLETPPVQAPTPAPTLPSVVSGAIDRAAAQQAPAAPAADPGRMMPTADQTDVSTLGDMVAKLQRGGFAPVTNMGGMQDPALYEDRLRGAMANPLVNVESKSQQWGQHSLKKKDVAEWDKAKLSFKEAGDKLAAQEQKAAGIKTQENMALLKQEAAATARQFNHEQKIIEQNNKRLAAYERDANKLKLAIDPERAWNSKNAFQKAAFYVAAIGEGLLLGRGGGPSIFDMYQREAEADVAAQKAEYEAKKEGLARKWSIYGAFKELGNDSAESYRKAIAFKMRQAKDRSLAMIQKAETPQVAARWQKAYAEFDSKEKKALALAQGTNAAGSKTVSQRENPEIGAYQSMLMSAASQARKEGKFNPVTFKKMDDAWKTVSDLNDFSDKVATVRDWIAKNPDKPVPVEMRKSLSAAATKQYIMKNRYDEAMVNTGELAFLSQDQPDLNDEQNLKTWVMGDQFSDDQRNRWRAAGIRGMNTIASVAAAGGDGTGQHFLRIRLNPESAQKFIAEEAKARRASMAIKGKAPEEPTLAGKARYLVKEQIRKLRELPTGQRLETPKK